jgi:hypothetical protein
MPVEELLNDLLEQTLVVAARLVAVDVWPAVDGEDGADVGVLELDRAVGAAIQLRRQPPPMLGLGVRHTAVLLQEHREVVGDYRLDLVEGPVVRHEREAGRPNRAPSAGQDRRTAS